MFCVKYIKAERYWLHGLDYGKISTEGSKSLENFSKFL